MLWMTALAAATAAPSEGALEAWDLCLQAHVSLAAREEPSDDLVVAEAFLHCARWEPAVRAYMVQGVARETGDASSAEEQGELLLLSLKVNASERLLKRSRRTTRTAQR